MTTTGEIFTIVSLIVGLLSPVFSVIASYATFRALTDWRLTSLEKRSESHGRMLRRIDKGQSLIAQAVHAELPDDTDDDDEG
jgi:hypothetical protein